MDIKEAQQLFAALSTERQVRLLVAFGHSLTIGARDTYEFQQPGVRDPERLRAVNEIQHRVLGHILALLTNATGRYPDDVLISILLTEFGDEHVRSQALWSFEDALKR